MYQSDNPCTNIRDCTQFAQSPPSQISSRASTLVYTASLSPIAGSLITLVSMVLGLVLLRAWVGLPRSNYRLTRELLDHVPGFALARSSRRISGIKVGKFII